MRGEGGGGDGKKWDRIASNCATENTMFAEKRFLLVREDFVEIVLRGRQEEREREGGRDERRE